MEPVHLVTPIDFLFGVFGFSGGILAAIKVLRRQPLRNASIFLQVSLLIIKMANHYFTTHPEAKEKINKKIEHLLEKISHDLKIYMNQKDEVRRGEYAG